DSAEEIQNAEPSIAVNPANPMQMVIGAFGGGNPVPNNPYFVSNDGGATWFDFGSIDHLDKSIAWTPDGSAVLTAVLIGSHIDTYSAASALVTSGGNFGSVINDYVGSDDNDQPWLRTGSNRVYLAFNDDGGPVETGSINVSTDGGLSY